MPRDIASLKVDSMTALWASERQEISHSKGSGTLRKPGIMVVVGSTGDPSRPVFFRMLKPHSVREMTMNNDFSAMCTPGHARLNRDVRVNNHAESQPDTRKSRHSE